MSFSQSFYHITSSWPSGDGFKGLSGQDIMLMKESYHVDKEVSHGIMRE